MTRRELFQRLGGLSSDFPVNYNDVDYCLKLRRDGRRAVYDPDLVMLHFESSSRSSAVADWEKNLLKERWLPLTATDPDSNPHLVGERPKLLARLNFARRRVISSSH
jgi:GT2 family glycosyltransferase